MHLEASKKLRYLKTREFLKKCIGTEKEILDLGEPSPFSQALKQEGFEIINTAGENLDVEYMKYANTEVDVVTAFEIFEHLMAPFNILRALKAQELVASVPLNLWFAKVYWNPKDPWDCHYHEFEKKQFDMLLDRTGWEIVDRMSWPHHAGGKLGVRPFLRRFFDRYYMVYCRRKPDYVVPDKPTT
jgi:hypothetical protein